MSDNDSNNKNVLVIEDEPIIARVCSRILKMDGYSTDIADNGEIAMEMVRKREYDIYICDIKMPGMSGIEFYNLIKEQYPERINRLIMITGDLLSSDTREFLRDINIPYILKPFTPDELREAIVKLKAGPAAAV
jgi:two-component system sensor histidine kinase/response regulator